MLRYHYRIDPDTMEDDEWLRLYAEYRYVRKTELKEYEIAVRNALTGVINEMFAEYGFNNNGMDSKTRG